MAEVVSTALAWLISNVSLMVGRAEVTFWTLGGRMITGTTPTKRQAWKATMSSKPRGGATGGATINTYIHLPYIKCVCVCVRMRVCWSTHAASAPVGVVHPPLTGSVQQCHVVPVGQLQLVLHHVRHTLCTLVQHGR